MIMYNRLGFSVPKMTRINQIWIIAFFHIQNDCMINDNIKSLNIQRTLMEIQEEKIVF